MPSFASLVVLAALPAFAAAELSKRATVQTFAKPADSPFSQSNNYVGQSNGSLPKTTPTPGKSFDRFIQIWMENTDFQVAATTPGFQKLAAEGILLTNYVALTHPSEPNYIGAMGGDFFASGDDDFYAIPENITTLVDLLEDGGASGGKISWSCYQENMPTDNFLGMNYSSVDYISPGSPNYTYYERKHDPCSLYNSIANNTERAKFSRNFNDLAVDLNNSVIPQWLFITPNIVNDGHDSDPEFMSAWLEYFLAPLLNDTRFNDNKTLILLTFDENESQDQKNQVFSLLLGGVVPASSKGTNDSTFYTHYSTISTVEHNWQLKHLGRGDANKTMANVFALVANATGYKNVDVPAAQQPLTNATGIFNGPLNAAAYVPFTAPPNQSAIGPGGQPVLMLPGLNASFTPSVAPAPVNLTSQGLLSPWAADPNITVTASTFTNSSTAPESSKGAAIPLSASSYAPVFAGILAMATLFV